MNQKPIQLEIFEQEYKIKKAQEHSINLPKKPINPNRFPIALCVKAACALIIILIGFAFGVERGKKIRQPAIATPAANTKNDVAKVENIQKVTKKTTAQPQKIASLENNAAAVKKLENKQKDDIILTSGGYIIQLVTYKKDSSYIDKEIANLKKKGVNAITIPSGDYVVICAGRFKSKQEAQTNLKKLKQIYKDCFIRKI